MGANRVCGPEEAHALATRLNGTARERPIAVVSIPAASVKPWIDVAELEVELGPLVEIWTISTGPDTWALTRSLPPGTQVYGGAGRVYPVGHEWTHDLSYSPLRFAFDQKSGRAATRQLISDGLGMAADAGLLRQRTGPSFEYTSGIVRGLPTPDRALIEMPNRKLAAVAQELTLPDVPLDRILSKGMNVFGLFDQVQRRFDIRRMIRPPDQVQYDVGSVVLAMVVSVEDDTARFQLFPGLEVVVDREAITSNERDDLRSFFTIGEVTTTRVLANGPSWALGLIDIDDDEVPGPAPSVVEGGPSWIDPPAPPAPWLPLVEPSEAEALLVTPDLDTLPLEPPEEIAPRPKPVIGPSPIWLDPRRRLERPSRRRRRASSGRGARPGSTST